MASGMNDHVNKPIDPTELYRALVKWISPRETTPTKPAADHAEFDDPFQEYDVPILPGFDVDQALARMGGNPQFYRKILRKFIASEAHTIANIQERLAAGDHESAVRAAHSLKGVAGNIGATTLQTLAARLEVALRDDPGHHLEDRLNETSRELRNAIQTIAATLDEALPAEPTELRPEALAALAPILEKLRGQIESYDSEAADTCELLVRALNGTPAHAMATQLDSALEAYNFDEARKIFDTLVMSNTGEKESE